jgi:hypothetical protein
MNFTGLILLSTALTPGQLEKDFHQDFRKNPTKPGVLKFMGKNAKKLIQFKQGGVHFAFPANKGGQTPVGIGPRFKLRGDFTITAAFEILQEAEPAPDSAGLNLHIYIDTNTTHGATVLRSYKPGKGIQLIAHELTRGSDGKGKHVFHPIGAATKFAKGQLQLKRVGKKLAYLTAGAEGSAFQQFYETEWVTEDVRQIRVGGTNSKAATPFAFRILALDIKSDEMPTYAVAPEAGSLLPVILTIIVLVVVIAAAGVGIWKWRKSK